MSIDDFLGRARVFIARIEEAKSNDHAVKLRAANLVLKSVNAFIVKEVEEAQSHPKNSSSYLSWDHIGQALEISKSAAFARYGGKK